MTIDQERAAPRRIQRRRTRGWRMPLGAVYVGRPGRFGNPWRIGDQHPWYARPIRDAAEAVALYRDTIARSGHQWRAEVRRDLGGRHLVCWCPPDQPCHADVLLTIANSDPGS